MVTSKFRVNLIYKIQIKISNYFLFIVSVFVISLSLIACSNPPINVLILSGQNNHDWQETTPLIKNILEKSGKFTVDTTNAPEKLNPESLSQYDVILSNWNTWPDVEGNRWSSELEKSFLDFIALGKGFVVIHAGSSSLQDWPEFQQVSGGTWELGVTGHGPIHIFNVKIENPDNPITKGLNEFYIKDELWHQTKFQNEVEVLCSAFSSKEKKGTGENEPVLITTKYGKGRGVYCVLGHNKYTMNNNAWKTLLLRGTEWAATGNVTIEPILPWPDNYEVGENQSSLAWQQSDSTIALLQNGKILWQFNIPKIGKPFFHPINDTEGNTLTWVRPDDHPWHYGLWFSWKYINGLNYWEEDKETKLSEGITKVVKSDFKKNEDYSTEIKLLISYQPKDGEAILTEDRLLTISVPHDSGDFNIDWDASFTPTNKDIILERTPIEGQEGGRLWGGYAGLGLRINSKVFSEISLLNDEGKWNLDIHTQPTKWTDISGKIIDEPSNFSGITVFENTENLRYPVPGYVINSPLENEHARFVYTGSGFLYNSGYTIKGNDTLKLSYRIYVHNSKGELKKLNNEYNNYKKSPK